MKYHNRSGGYTVNLRDVVHRTLAVLCKRDAWQARGEHYRMSDELFRMEMSLAVDPRMHGVVPWDHWR